MPLRPDTAIELQAFLAGKLPSVPVFKVPDKTAKMLRADLSDVGIPYVDEAGRYADFHALRHSTGSLLAASGAHPKIVQSLMRHSDINLTMSRYTHVFRGQESEAVANLPDLSSPSKEQQRLMGTDDRAAESAESAYKPAYKKLAKNAYSGCPQSANIGTDDSCNLEKKSETNDFDKSLQASRLGTKKEPVSSPDSDSKNNAPDTIRTCNLRFRRPMLYPIELQALQVPNGSSSRII